MNPSSNKINNLYRLFALFVVALLLGVGFYWFINRNKTASLKIEAAPLDSKITLNGSMIKQGEKRLEPGSYSIEISRDGFLTYTTSITLNAGSNEYIGSALTPNSTRTENWYENHPEDQKMAEKISSINFDKSTTEAAEVPIATRLPFIGPGSSFRIDYDGVDGKKAKLIITATDEETKNDALSWITTQGFNPNDYEITYILPGTTEDVGD